jgi:hypothetical protein
VSGEHVTVLYRAIGAAEFALLVRRGFAAWPPRLADQPIVHLATSQAHATDVAREWNARDAASSFVGYVTKCAVRSAFLAPYPLRRVGGRHHEYWIPAEHLAHLNANLVGPIQVLAELRPDAVGR